MSGRFRLDGRTVLLTGGSGFLGRQWAAALSEAGATVVSVDVVPPAEAGEHDGSIKGDGSILHEQVDITDPIAVRALADTLAARGIEVDVLVNNAAVDAPVQTGGLASNGRLEDFALQRWDREISVGLTGAMLCAQVFGTRMAERGSGVIINVGSDLALIGPDQRLYEVDGVDAADQPVKPVTYSVIKSGLIGLTRYLATYWADRGVRSNIICLGGVARDQDPAFVKRLSERVPLGRMAQPDEYGDAMVFLCSDASSYMTGSVVVLDGGRTSW